MTWFPLEVGGLLRIALPSVTEIKNYYNDITHNNLDLIKTLKEDVAEMKKREAQVTGGREGGQGQEELWHNCLLDSVPGREKQAWLAVALLQSLNEHEQYNPASGNTLDIGLPAPCCIACCRTRS
jgi:hypothetical protein